jgi:hypothetical protein
MLYVLGIVENNKYLAWQWWLKYTGIKFFKNQVELKFNYAYRIITKKKKKKKKGYPWGRWLLYKCTL